ncbi:hypothetical protein N482_24835 [Pseudoalteromonas luteoviolacea NCIMB 1942]|uniref:Uncharacterized protein n=2 Tax=Pseudoalteromonas luteoviolacea TaxID=43657 RepID=A0A167G0K5_9GAMM|nr:hypothetical protein N482_24835 [Pseudoalteromonas luteoviolacea NCIMB 1942]
MGLGVTPQTVLPSLWINGLFGEIASGQESQLKSLMDFYNICMDRIMCNTLELPQKCVLQASNLQAALQENMPLPSYCKGMLAALSFIDRSALRSEQLKELNWLCRILKGFSSYINARNIFGTEQRNFEIEVQEAKQSLITRLSSTIHQMRFSEQCLEQAQEPATFDGFNRTELESHLHNILSKDDECTLSLINDLILVIERELITEQFKLRHKSEFDKLFEAQPYLILRGRKAQIQFNMGNIEAATDELETLLPLTLNDAYKNRYQLYNCYVKQKSWCSLDELLLTKSEGSFGDLATRTLLAFAQGGNTQSARKLKSELKTIYPAVELLFDPSKGSEEGYSELCTDTVNEYINRGGKKAWCSVNGGLFWLKSND